MSQIFHHSTNTFARITIFGAIFVIGFLAWAFAELDRSTYETRATQAREHLTVAMENSNTRSEHDLYAAKLDRLRALRPQR